MWVYEIQLFKTRLTDSAKEFDAERRKDEEEKKEEQSEVADFRQRLYDSVEQGAN